LPRAGEWMCFDAMQRQTAFFIAGKGRKDHARNKKIAFFVWHQTAPIFVSWHPSLKCGASVLEYVEYMERVFARMRRAFSTSAALHMICRVTPFCSQDSP